MQLKATQDTVITATVSRTAKNRTFSLGKEKVGKKKPCMDERAMQYNVRLHVGVIKKIYLERKHAKRMHHIWQRVRQM